MTIGPTPRQLDALAAWWQCGGSNIAAARVLGVTPQVMRNTLMAFRREERAATNIALIQRFLSAIDGRRITPHNSGHSEPLGPPSTKEGVAAISRDSRSVRSPKVTEHLLGGRLGRGSRPGTFVPRTRVRIAYLRRERLRKQMVQSPTRRRQPLYLRNASPASFISLLVLDGTGHINAPVLEVQPRPHEGSVA